MIQRDKDAAVIITLIFLLVFLLSSISCAVFECQTDLPPEPVLLARCTLSREYLRTISISARMVSTVGMVAGLLAAIFWPPRSGH